MPKQLEASPSFPEIKKSLMLLRGLKKKGNEGIRCNTRKGGVFKAGKATANGCLMFFNSNWQKSLQL